MSSFICRLDDSDVYLSLQSIFSQKKSPQQWQSKLPASFSETKSRQNIQSCIIINGDPWIKTGSHKCNNDSYMLVAMFVI